MAILGGAGNVAGSNPAGTGTSINYLNVGDRTLCYGYSGSITLDGTDQVYIDHTTGNETIEGKIMLQYLQTGADADDFTMKVELNGEAIAGQLTIIQSTFADSPPIAWLPIIIPPYSRFRILMTMLTGSGSIDVGVTVTGRSYY